MILLFIITFIASVLFVYFIRRILIHADITDKPIVTEHKHKTGTPTMGGIGLLIALLFVTAIYFKHSNIVVLCLVMLMGGIVGLFDDFMGLRVQEVQKIVENIYTAPVKIGQLTLKIGEQARVATDKAKAEVDNLVKEKKMKIVGETPIKVELGEQNKIISQILIGLLLVATGSIKIIFGMDLWILAIILSIIAIIGVVNSINLIDGMDGLAAGILFIASTSCAIFIYLNQNYTNTFPFIILAALSLGFLIFNKYPAKIFMGDTGSVALGAGFATAVLLADIIPFGIISIIVPIVSVIISLMHRAHIFRLPVEPLHHTLHHRGMSEKKIIFLYWGLTFLACLISLLAYKFIIM